MKQFGFYITLLVIVLGFACRKKEYPRSSEENAPVFYSTATVDGEAFSFTAGRDNYQAYSSFTEDTNRIYNFIGDLKKNDCSSDCPRSLRIQINDYKPHAPGSLTNIDSALKIGNYDYLNDTAKTTYTVKFHSDYGRMTAASYKWDFADGSTSTEPNPTHIYTQPGSYNVCLQIIGDNGCVANICNMVFVGSGAPLNSCIMQVNAGTNWGAFKQVTIGGKPPYKYLWSFGDGTFSNEANPTHVFKIKGGYQVELRVTDANNTTVVNRYNYVSQNDVYSCACNFNMDVTENLYANVLSKIVVSWTDANGLKYVSSNRLQPVNSAFRILSVENFENNTQNEKTKKLNVKFNCAVYNGNKALKIDNAEAIICVSYK